MENDDDDLVIYIRCKSSDIDERLRSLTNDIENISKWCMINKLLLNHSKTKAMYFGSTINICRLNELLNRNRNRLYICID